LKRVFVSTVTILRDDDAGGTNLVTVETKTRFKTQAVARAEADGEHFGFAEQCTGDPLRILRFERDFETVFAGVAGAADDRGRAGDSAAHDFHEGHLSMPGGVAFEHGARRRALQREQRAIGFRFEGGNTFQLFRDVGEIAFLRAGVDDEVERGSPVSLENMKSSLIVP